MVQRIFVVLLFSMSLQLNAMKPVTRAPELTDMPAEVRGQILEHALALTDTHTDDVIANYKEYIRLKRTDKFSRDYLDSIVETKDKTNPFYGYTRYQKLLLEKLDATDFTNLSKSLLNRVFILQKGTLNLGPTELTAYLKNKSDIIEDLRLLTELLINIGKLDTTCTLPNEDGGQDNVVIFAAEANLTPIVDQLLKGIRFSPRFRPIIVHGKELFDIDQALIRASALSLNELAKKLIDRGANINSTDGAGRTPLIIALQVRNQKLALFLIQRNAKVNVQSNNGLTPLIIACDKGFFDVVKKLIGSHANVNIKGPNDRTALVIALEYRHYEIAEYLLNHAADFEIEDTYGDTPLTLCCRLAAPSPTIQLLLDKKANVHHKDNQGQTPLIAAAASHSSTPVETINLLLKYGASINDQSNVGNTALITAISNGNAPVALELIKKNANVNLTTKTKETALMITSLLGLPYPDILNSYAAIAQELCTHGAKVNETNEFGNTALHFAALSKDWQLNVGNKILGILLQHGAHVNVQNNEGDTPLMYACMRDNVKAVQMLLSAHANANTKDKQGNTALKYAKTSEIIDLIKAALAEQSKK